MSTTVKTGWLNDKNGDKFAPKTLTSQVQTSDGTLLEDKIQNDLDIAKAESMTYINSVVSGFTSASFVNTSIDTHNTSTSAHNDIRELIRDITTKLNNFLDVDDTTTDQLSEIITLINNNKGTLESITTNKINVSDIVNNLTTNSASKVLSAAQGVAIKALIDALQTVVNGKASSVHTHKISDVTNLQSSLNEKVPVTRTINDKTLNSNITLTASDVGAYSKNEIDDYEFITIEDIDTICGASIQVAIANEVTF